MSEVIKNSINLYHGDCLEKLKLIKDGSIDLILTDPPYGTTACNWDTVIPFDKLWLELKRVIKPNGAVVLFGSEPFSSALRMSNIKQFKYDWVWQKEQGTNQFLAKYQPLKKHEIISVFGKGTLLYNPQKTEGKRIKSVRDSKARKDPITNVELKPTAYDNKGLRYPVSIIDFKRELQNRLHPTQKPVALLEYLIKTYTNENETVLDFTIGSGSTCIAAMNTKRNCIGIELDNNYFNVSSKRIEDHNETLETKYTIT